MTMRKLTSLFLALTMLVALAPIPVAAEFVFLPPNRVVGIAASSTNNTTGSACLAIKYRGTTAGQPTVTVASGGDLTLSIPAGTADVTTGSPSLDGIFDLSSPAAAVDTMGELVTLINTTGSNWQAALISCLAADLTNDTITTISATEVPFVGGLVLTRDAAVASATSVFSAQVLLVPEDAATDAGSQFFFSGTRVNTNPFEGYQPFVQYWRENITSSGTVALNEILGVKRTYSSTGRVSETVRVLWAITGANSTVEATFNYAAGPLVGATGELIVVRQRTATALTVQSIQGAGFIVKQ
jgi:hypothetical protein